MRYLILILFLGTGFISSAQLQKIGHLNGREMLMAMPESTVVEEQIQAQAKEMESAIITMQKDYQKRVEEFQQNPDWSIEVKNQKYEAIIQMEKDMKDFTAKAESELDAKESELLGPIYQKIQEAIKAVAIENNFIYIIDSSQGVLLYEGGEDVMPLLKKKLGIQ